MGVLSLAWGILAVLGMLVAFFPCLGALNWINVPFSGLGLIVSIVALAGSRSKGAALGGVICCSVAVFFGLFRLFLGGGIL
jgi:hypothetical protein